MNPHSSSSFRSRRSVRLLTGAGATAAVAVSAVGLAPAAHATPLPPSPYVLTTLAGNGSSGTPVPGTAATSPVGGPLAVAVDAAGNVYVADGSAEVVEKITPAGVLSIIAGTGTSGATVPGPATASPLSNPYAIAVGPDGSVYVSDAGTNATIDKITPNGQLSIVAGQTGQGLSLGRSPTPGPATSTSLGEVAGLTVAADGTLYATDDITEEIYKITPDGTLSVIGGSGVANDPVPGPATSSPFYYPRGIAVDSSGNVFVAAWYSSAIVKITPGGTLSVVAGTVASPGSATPGPATASVFEYPSAVAIDPRGNLYISDDGNDVVDKIDTSGTLSVIAGNETQSPMVNGPALNSPVGDLLGIAVGANGAVYLADRNGTVARLDGPALDLTGTVGAMTVGTPFSGSVNALGSPAPTYAVTAGSLPAGLTLDATTGAITGTPKTAGAYSFTVTATNSHGSASNTFSGTVALAPVVTTPATPTATSPVKKVALPALAIPLAKRKGEIAVPAHPNAYRGALVKTVAAGRSRHGINTFAITTLHGYQLHKGQAAELGNDALFAFDSATLTAKGRAELKTLAASLKQAKKISCEGYTDFGGVASHELTLSQQRAAAVCKALKADGAHVTVTTSGYGGTRPAVVGGNPAARVANRRVVVVVTA